MPRQVPLVPLFCELCVMQNSHEHLHHRRHDNNIGVHHQEAKRTDPRPLRPPLAETHPAELQLLLQLRQVDQEQGALVIRRAVILQETHPVVLAAVRQTHLRLLLRPTTPATLLVGVDNVNNLTKLTDALIQLCWQFWQLIQGDRPTALRHKHRRSTAQ